MTGKEKEKLLKSDNIRTVSQQRIEDLFSIEDWFVSNETEDSDFWGFKCIENAIGFISALVDAYCELNDNGYVSCNDDETANSIKPFEGDKVLNGFEFLVPKDGIT